MNLNHVMSEICAYISSPRPPDDIFIWLASYGNSERAVQLGLSVLLAAGKIEINAMGYVQMKAESKAHG